MEENKVIQAKHFLREGFYYFRVCFDRKRDKEDASGRFYCGYVDRYYTFANIQKLVSFIQVIVPTLRDQGTLEHFFEGMAYVNDDSSRMWNDHLLYQKRGEVGSMFLFMPKDPGGDPNDDLGNDPCYGFCSVMVERRIRYEEHFENALELKAILQDVSHVFYSSQNVFAQIRKFRKLQLKPRIAPTRSIK